MIPSPSTTSLPKRSFVHSPFSPFSFEGLKNLRTDSVYLRPEGRGQRGFEEFLGWIIDENPSSSSTLPLWGNRRDL